MKKTVLITGVTSGVGEKTAQKFIKKGCTVIGLARNEKKLKELKEVFGDDFIFYKTNLEDQTSIITSFKKISQITKNIDILVNNAATFKMKKFSEYTYEDINSLIDTNLKALIFVTLETLKIMRKNKNGGRIINIGSVASIRGIKEQSIYCATKYGINGFSEALNQELIPYNISISTIFPGGIDTPLWNKNNPYPGTTKNKILKIKDIVDLVLMISKLKKRIILKNLTIFPSNEWH